MIGERAVIDVAERLQLRSIVLTRCAAIPLCNVANGSKTEVAPLERQVRSTLKSRHRQVTPACPKSATSGLMHRSISRDAASGTHSGKARRAKAFSNIARRFGFLTEAKVNNLLKLELRRCGYRARM